MQKEEQTAQTSEQSQVDSHADIDEQAISGTENTENEVEFTDSDEEASKTSEASAEGAKQKEESKNKTNEQNNSENARRRREAERQREIKAAREQAVIEALGGKNPYTNEEMKDSADVEEYLLMKEIEKSGGDPLSDFSKYHKSREREKAEKAAKEEQEKEWYKNDREEFVSKYPDVNLENLVQDKQFQLFAGGKVGRLPLSKIYESFIEIVGEYEKKAKQQAKQLLANSKSTPGALASPNVNDSGFYTREQVQKMSQEEVHKNYDKIRASMTKWK